MALYISLGETYVFSLYPNVKKKKIIPALAGMALSWLECHQDTYPGCGFDSWSGHVWEETNQCFTLSLLSPVPFSKKKKNQ